MRVDDYSFGRIWIGGKEYATDLWIINGKISKRHKSISRVRLGTSHKVCKKELERVVTGRTKRVVIGTGASGLLSLEKEGIEYLKEKGIKLEMHKTGELAGMKMEFNEYDSWVIHITC